MDNIRVLDLTRLLPGPLLTLFLADLGAEVIKIEDTEQGDYLRWMSMAGDSSDNLFEALNRDKKGIRLNLKTHDGIEIFKKLAKDADVIVEGFRPGVMDKLGIGYDTISKINQKIVFCSITGYGKNSPYSEHAGHDLNYIGIAGILGVNGEKDKPDIPGVQIGDIAGGSIVAFGAIMLGLFNRERTGKGLYFDISMTDSLLVFMAPYIPFIRKGIERKTMELVGSVPCYNIYKTRDGKFITLGALEPKFWKQFLQKVNRTDLIEEQLAKGKAFERVYNEIQQIFLTRTRNEWIEFFKNEDVCIEPVNELNELLEDPHVKHSNMFVYVKEADSLTIRNPFYREGSLDTRCKKAPTPGEHTVEILRNAGYSEQDIEQFRKQGVIQ
ncbi:MAG: CaiB/BaiF CoA transferase family protein [bacterium]